ncbi:YALIA101S06e04544g1_1 [Yarrowia lipolytica]|nr:YALIA101S06e04544g1_1 [Yarrowia lipolytica]
MATVLPLGLPSHMKLAPPDLSVSDHNLSEPEHADLSSSSQDSDDDHQRHKRAAVESFFFARSHNNKAGLVMQIQRLAPKGDQKTRPTPLFNVQRKKHRLLKPVHGILRSVEGAAGIVGANSSRRHSDQFYCTRHSTTALTRNNSGRCRVVEGATLPVPKSGFNQIAFDGIEMESSPPTSPYLGGADHSFSSVSLPDVANTTTGSHVPAHHTGEDDSSSDRGVYHVYTVDEHPQSAGRITHSDIRFNVSASEADQSYIKDPSSVSPQTSATGGSRRQTLPPRDSLQAFLATPITWHLKQVGARTYRLVDSSTDMAIGYWTGERGWRFVSKGETLMSLSEKVRVYSPMFRKPMYLDQVVHRLRTKHWADKSDEDSHQSRRRRASTVPHAHGHNYRVTLVDAILFSAIQLLMQQQLQQAAAESMVVATPSLYTLPQSDSQLSFKNVRRSLSLSRPKLDSRQSLQLDHNTRPETEKRKSFSEHRKSWTGSISHRRKSVTPSPPPNKRMLDVRDVPDLQEHHHSTPKKAVKPPKTVKHTRFDSQPENIPTLHEPARDVNVSVPARRHSHRSSRRSAPPAPVVSHFHEAISEPIPAVQAAKKRNLVARFFQKVKQNMK